MMGDCEKMLHGWGMIVSLLFMLLLFFFLREGRQTAVGCRPGCRGVNIKFFLILFLLRRGDDLKCAGYLQVDVYKV